MPNSPPLNDYDLPEDERFAKRQAERRQREAEHRQREAEMSHNAEREQYLKRLQALYLLIINAVQQALGAEARKNIWQKRLNVLEKHSPTFVNAGPKETFGYCIFVMGAIAVICINYFLINAPVHYLASIPFADENAWQIGLSTLLVPVALLIFELCIALGRKTAREEESPNVWQWNLAGFVMVLVTPTMIIGAMLARPDWFDAYNLVTSLGMISLAGVTDAMVVFGGEYIFVALSFVYFKYAHSRLQNETNRTNQQYRTYHEEVESTWVTFQETYTNYTTRYPNFPLNLPFSKETREFVNQIYPGAIAEPAPLPLPPENPPPTLTVSAPRTPQNPPPPAPAETPNSESEPNAEVEYLQNQKC